MKRRKFIALTSASTVVAGVSYLYFSRPNNASGESIRLPHSLAIILDTDLIGVIGNNYLKQFPMEANESTLLKHLDVNSVHDRVEAKIIKKRVTKDFEIGNIIIVDGWVLSITEARQCALFSITNNT